MKNGIRLSKFISLTNSPKFNLLQIKTQKNQHILIFEKLEP